MHKTVLSTGVIIRGSDEFNANITVLNLDPVNRRTVTIEIFDWGVEQLWSNATTLPIQPTGPTTIDPNTQRDFVALITESTARPGEPVVLYEIRATVDEIADVVINCYAVASNGQPIAGKTIRHNDLVVIPVV